MSQTQDTIPATWKANFETHRQILFRKYFRRGYVEKSSDYIERLHVPIELHPETWSIPGEYPLFRGFCTVKYTLMISFQASLKYVKQVYGRQLVTDVNQRLKDAYQTTVTIRVEDTLARLDGDIDFVEKLPKLKSEIEQLINTDLSNGYITCSTRCDLETNFDLNALESANFTYQDMYTQIKQKHADFEKEKRQKNAEIASNERTQIAEIESEEKHEIADIESKAADELHQLEINGQNQTARHAREKNQAELQQEKADLQHEEEKRTIQREKIDNLEAQNALDKKENEAKVQSEVNKDLFELDKFEEKAKNADRWIQVIKTDIEILKAENEKAVIEERPRVIQAEAEQKLRELDIEIEGLRIKTQNAPESERISKILDILPKLVEEANRHPQPIEHLSILQTGSPPVFSRDQNGSADTSANVIGPALQVYQSIHIIKEVLRLLGTDSSNP